MDSIAKTKEVLPFKCLKVWNDHTEVVASYRTFKECMEFVFKQSPYHADYYGYYWRIS